MVARIARRQHGVVSLEQLAWAGMSASTVSRRLRQGWLYRVYRGVYAVGHTDLSKEGRWLAAVLACGDQAVLSHDSAAHLWGISPTSPSTIHVTVPATGGRARRPGIHLHRSTTIGPAHTTRRHNIPVTTHARTLADLGYGPERTRSDLERLFLRICKEHEVPKPETNVKVGPYTVDFLWRAERLVVEVDSYRYHSSHSVFTSDRVRDRELRRRGLEVDRYTDRELTREPAALAKSLKAQLQRRMPASGPR